MKKILLLTSALAAFFSFLILFTQDYSSIFYPDETSAYQNVNRVEQQIRMVGNYDYVLDLDESSLEWSGTFEKTEVGHRGTVDFLSGGIYVGDQEILGGEFVLDMTSIIDYEKTSLLVQHLKSDDFFAAAAYPYAYFRLQSFEHLEDNVYQARGVLTIRGISREVVFPASVKHDRDTYLASASFSIDRTKWNVTYGSSGFFEDLGERVIDDDVEISLNLVAKKK